MHDVRAELKASNGRFGRLENYVEGVAQEICLTREENHRNTDRLIEAFGRSMEPLINQALDQKQRLKHLEE